MEKDSFWQKLLYRKVYLGTVEKEGQVFKKYKTERRFRPTRNTIIFLVLLGILFFGLLYYSTIKEHLSQLE